MIELLKGVRVLESALLFLGDQTGRLLGDLGADVIKIEAPGTGDYLRDILGQITPHNSPPHLVANRNKRSVTLDLRAEEGRAVFFDLLQGTDIFVDGFAGNTMERLGIGHEQLRQRKPDIIYVQCTGFGASGPYATVPTHGYMMGAEAGTVFFEMNDHGLAEEVATTLGDGSQVGATFSALTALAALVQRSRTGQGAYIDGSGADAVIATCWVEPLYAWNASRITNEEVNPLGAPRYRAYETGDQRIMLFCCAERKFWTGFCDAVDRPDLRTRFPDAPMDFGEGDDELVSMLQDLFRTRTLEEWMAVASAHRLPIGPVHRPEALLDDPHLQSRQILHREVHPDAGPITTIGWPAVVAGQAFDIQRSAPALGEHTEEVLTELGYSPARIKSLRELRVI
jgi:formyl-CoA transferase